MIEFIPVLELPTKKDKESEKHPKGTSLTNTKDWNNYQETELSKNYQDIGKPISKGVFQYRLLDLSNDDLIKVIRLHISDMDIKDSCSLFGGYALKIDNEIVLYPQCCGLLEEINDWAKLLIENFDSFYLMECHPSPKFTKKADKVIIDCNEDDTGPFFPPTDKQIIVDYNDLKNALIKLMDSLKLFSQRLDELSDYFRHEKISDILIWGK